jgi:hypothetical protein
MIIFRTDGSRLEEHFEYYIMGIRHTEFFYSNLKKKFDIK